jgi:hypothetical protein
VPSTYNDGGYEELAGTSRAKPFVSGVAALLASEGIRGQAAVKRILATADDAGAPGPDGEYGAGIVDAAAAVANPGGGGGGPTGSSGSKPAAGGPAGFGPSSGPSISIARRISRAGLLRRGLPARWGAAGLGTCDVVARCRKTVVARGAEAVTLTKPALVRARVTRAGRRLLARRRGTLRLAVVVRCPGITPKNTLVAVVGR